MCNHLSQLFFSFLFYFLRHSNLTFLNQLGILLEKHLRSHLPYVRRRLVDPVQLYIQTTRAELLRSQLSAGRRGRINGQVGQAKLALQGNGRRAGYRCRKKNEGASGMKERPQEQRDTVRINLGLVRFETASCSNTREVFRSTF